MSAFEKKRFSAATNGWGNLGCEKLDHLRDLGEGQAADIDLRKKALVTQQFALIQDLIDDLLRTADENRAVPACALLIVGPRYLLRAILRGSMSCRK